VPHGVEIPSIKVDGVDGVEFSLQNGIVIRNVLIFTAVKNSLVSFFFLQTMFDSLRHYHLSAMVPVCARALWHVPNIPKFR
jgi:tRNA U34 5-methylaminomethyl-2-thiouridine-forming methyltransferase MnmC